MSESGGVSNHATLHHNDKHHHQQNNKHSKNNKLPSGKNSRSGPAPPPQGNVPLQNLWRLPGELPVVEKQKLGIAGKLGCGVFKQGSPRSRRMGPWLPLNPFVQHMRLTTAYDKIKVLLMTLTVLPIRAASILVCLVAAWLVAFVGMAGAGTLSGHDRPIAGWRKEMRHVVCVLVRFLFACGGFHWVTVKGKQASAKEAPILALAPHSTYFDALPVVCLGAPSIVAKGETQFIPFFGKFITFTEPLYVFREDPESRQKTIKEMIKRAVTPDLWPQVLIFPEGTCTNRSCLISFKPGAFIPGVPIQPVCIRYPNRVDTITWTWVGTSFWKIFWLTLTQFHSYCEIEFLPVYVPSAEEQENPKLYANNVRQLMARAMNIPLTEYTYEDCRLLLKMGTLDFGVDAERFQRLRLQMGLDSSPQEEALVTAWLLQDADGQGTSPSPQAPLEPPAANSLGTSPSPQAPLEPPGANSLGTSPSPQAPLEPPAANSLGASHWVSPNANNLRRSPPNQHHYPPLRDALVAPEELARALGIPFDKSTWELFCALDDKCGFGKGEVGDVRQVELNLYCVLVCWLGSAPRSTQGLRVLFGFIDPDGRGSVDLEQLRRALRPGQPFKPEEVKKLFRQFDRREKGSITFEDFQEVICLKPEYIKLFVILRRKVVTALQVGADSSASTPGSQGTQVSLVSLQAAAGSLSRDSWNIVKSKDE